MMLRLVLVLLVAGVGTTYAQLPSWKVNSYTIQFRVTNAGVNVNGSLEGLKYQLDFDPNQPQASHLSASVAVKTINTGISARDNHLQSANYFDAEQYPTISLESRSIQHGTKTPYIGTFALTIRGFTRIVNIPIEFIQEGDTGLMKGNFTINRLDYGIGGNSILIGEEVRVNISLDLEVD